jgi:hypothetical protein
MNAEEISSKKDSLSEKPQGFLQEQDKQVMSQSPSSPALNVDMLTSSSYPNKYKISAKIYYGLQGEIYD